MKGWIQQSNNNKENEDYNRNKFPDNLPTNQHILHISKHHNLEKEFTYT